MAYNKFIKNDGTIMLDLTDTTVSEETLSKDITAVDKYGNKIVGTLTDSPLPVEVSTEEEMTALLETGEIGSVYKYIGTSGTYENNALYELTEEESDPLQGTWVFNDELTFDTSSIYLDMVSFTDIFIYYSYNNISCAWFSIAFDSGNLTVRYDVDVNSVYNSNTGWQDETYKTIEITSTFEELEFETIMNTPITTKEKFLAWLQANATKQVSKQFTKLVAPMGTLDINENGAYNVTEYANANVSVDSPLPIEISTEEEMNELLISGELYGIYKYIGETTEAYEKDSLYMLNDDSYLTFSSPETFTLNINDNTKHWDGTLEYSTDIITWSKWDGTTILNSSEDGNLYMRGTGNTIITGSTDESRSWVLTGSNISCNGNIEYLLDYQTVINGEHPTMGDYCYTYMFYNNSSLITPPELPATTLASRCYEYMFEGCTNLTTTPQLPATTLADYCYYGMFEGCTNLATAPELPATTLAKSCYSDMFRDCTNLTAAPELPATTLAEGCYEYMFYGCTSLTTAPELPATELARWCYEYMFCDCTNLTTAPELPATTLTSSCYQSMFQHCARLTTAPELPATTLMGSCYKDMFIGCTSLTTPPELPATTLANWCYFDMFRDCTNLTTAPELPATTLAVRCYDNMFYGCTSLTTVPELPATTLAESCYYGMFSGCTSLTTTPELPATTLADYCYQSMFSRCTGLTTAPELPATTLATWCYYGMFSGCTSIKLSETQTEEYTTPYRIPTSGEGTIPEDATDALTSMFTNTGGTFTGTPTINKTYYLHSSNSVV